MSIPTLWKSEHHDAHPRDSPALFAEANGIRYAYRRFGEETGVPLLFMQHFRGGLDHWNPAITDGFGRDRPVILFDNAGVASSNGETPGTVETMADRARDFVNALGVRVGSERPIRAASNDRRGT